MRSLGVAVVAIGVIATACGSTSPSSVVPAPDHTSISPVTASATTPRSTLASPTGRDGAFDPIGVSLKVNLVVGGLRDPIDVAAPGDGSGRVFVVEQAGMIRVVSGGQLAPRPFLDIHDRITSGGERGLLGLAFHPAFPNDPRFFVDYTDVNGNTVIAEFRLDDANAEVGDPGSERILIRIDQPYPNHNGGAVVFGPDGMLYVSTGDGGSGGDPHGNGRRLDTLLAKVLRIDVDGPIAGGDAPYRIPDGNPFVGIPGARPEIWLTGLRNPWRMRFDGETGALWIGDVGQGAWEEIDVAPARTGGLDFGWNRMEGFHCFQPSTGCDESGLTPPVAEYGHDLGCAVIGGVVVRDPGQSPLNGGYLFSDACSGNLWLLDPAATGPRRPVLALGSGRSISSIALDEDGTVLATDLGKGELVTIAAPPR